MENLRRALAQVLLAVGLLGASGCSLQATPTLPPSPTLPSLVTATVVPTLTPPTYTPIPLSSPTAAVPPTAPSPITTSAPAPSGCTNRYAFVADISIPDGTPATPAQVFTKTWRVRNTGTCIWGEGYILAFEKGQAMTAIPSIAVPRTPPGAETDLSVLLMAPTQPGIYQGYWLLKNPQGVAISPSLWVKIIVTGS